MFFFMIVEGPIVTLAAAFLASLGYFSLTGVFVLSVAGDLVGDVFWYGVGRRWGRQFIARYGRYVGISDVLMHKVQKIFDRHGGKAILGAKSTTGLCLVTIIVSGMARMPLRTFLTYAFIGGVIWTSTLVFSGFFFGSLYEQIAQYISWAGWIVLFLSALLLVVLTAYKKKSAQNFLKETSVR